MKKIKMSVIVPTHGRVDLFKETLDSLIKQTTDEFEVIITDDSSTEEERTQIKNLVENAAETGLNIQYIFTKPNLRQAKNTNQGLRNAKGKYLRILHSDDLVAPECIAKEIEVFEQNPDCDFFHHYAIQFLDKIEFNPNVTVRQYNIFDGWLRRNIFTNTVLPTTLAFRKTVYDEIGGMDESYDFLCDWEFYFRILKNAYKHGKNSMDITQGLVGWRMHNNSTTGSMALVHFKEHERFIKHIVPIYRKEKILSKEDLTAAIEAATSYRYKRVIDDYYKYHNFKLPYIPIRWKSGYSEFLIYWNKCTKHINYFLQPFKALFNWLVQPVSIIYYLCKSLKELAVVYFSNETEGRE